MLKKIGRGWLCKLDVLFRLSHYPFILSRRYVIESSLEVSLGRFERGAFLVGLKIGMNEFDESIDVFRCYLMFQLVLTMPPPRELHTVSFC